MISTFDNSFQSVAPSVEVNTVFGPDNVLAYRAPLNSAGVSQREVTGNYQTFAITSRRTRASSTSTNSHCLRWLLLGALSPASMIHLITCGSIGRLMVARGVMFS